MKYLAFTTLLLSAACSPPSTEQQATADTTQANATSTPSESAASETTAPLLEATNSLADARTVGYGDYALVSSSSAMQARLSVTFFTNDSLGFMFDYQVADFCSDGTSGSIKLNDGTGTFVISDARYLTFTFTDYTVEVQDFGGELGVGTCQLSGTFNRCDGECEPISWEGFGEEEETVIEEEIDSLGTDN